MACKLSEGAIQALVNGESPVNPVLQCLGTKSIAGSGVERIRLLLSDGVHSFGTSMLASQINHLVTDGLLQTHTVVRVTQYQSTILQGTKRVLICLNMDIMKSAAEAGGRIGEPIPLTQASQVQGKPVVNGHSHNDNVLTTSTIPNQPSSMYSPKPSNKMPEQPTTPGGSQARVMPIASLTPYQNRWSVQARVTQKGQMREWKNARGEGKLFNFTIIDQSGDIRVTCFKEEAEKFYDMIEVGKVYYVSNATLKPANPQFNNTSHDYEMSLRRDSTVVLCETTDSVEVPTIQYNFKKIKALEQNINGLVDVIGIVKSVDDLSTIMIRSQNREAKVRKFLLVDQSGAEIRVTLWGNEAESFDGSNSPVVALKGAKVSDFGNCSLSTISSTTMSVNPDIPEACQLKQWYETGGSAEVTQSMTSSGGTGGASMANWKTLAEIKSENLGNGEKPDYVTTKVTILYSKRENVVYRACSTDQCNKKVIDLENGQYRCEKCNKSMDSFKYRMILNLHVADEYDSQWVTCFQEQGEVILGVSAQELGDMSKEDEDRFEAVMGAVNFKTFFMKLRIKMDRYNDEERTRVTVVSTSPVSYADYITKLRADIEQLQLL